MVEVVQHQVLGDREIPDQAVLVPVLRHVTEARAKGFDGTESRDIDTVKNDRSTDRGHGAEQCLGQFTLPVALHPRYDDDLTAAHCQIEVVDGHPPGCAGHRQVGDHQAFLPDVRRLFGHLQLDGTSDHHGGQFGFGTHGFGASDDLAAPDDRDVIGHLQHFTEFVGDEHNRTSLVAQRTHHVHQLVDLLRGQHRRRLIENQIAGVMSQGLQDLNPLLDANRQVLHERIWIDFQAVPSREFPDPPPGLLDVEEPHGAGFVTQHHVLRDRERGNQHEVLVHHADAGSHGLARIPQPQFLLPQPDLTFVGGQQPEEDVHQGGFSRAVLPEQAMDAPRNDIDTDVVVGREGTETFRDAFQRQHGSFRERRSHCCYSFLKRPLCKCSVEQGCPRDVPAPHVTASSSTSSDAGLDGDLPGDDVGADLLQLRLGLSRNFGVEVVEFGKIDSLVLEGSDIRI